MFITDVSSLLHIGTSGSSVNHFNNNIFGISINNSNAIIEKCKFFDNVYGVEAYTFNATSNPNGVLKTTILGLGQYTTTFDYNTERGVYCYGDFQQIDVSQSKFLVQRNAQCIEIRDLK